MISLEQIRIPRVAGTAIVMITVTLKVVAAHVAHLQPVMELPRE